MELSRSGWPYGHVYEVILLVVTELAVGYTISQAGPGLDTSRGNEFSARPAIKQGKKHPQIYSFSGFEYVMML